MTPGEWVRTWVVALVLAVLLMPLYIGISAWIGFAIVLGSILFINIALSSRFIMPLPQIIAIVGLIQLILAAWGNQYFLSHKPNFDIGRDIYVYMTYAGPVCLALILGLFLPLIRFHGGMEFFNTPVTATHLRAPLLVELRRLFLIGIAAKFLGAAAPGSLRFFVELIGLLSYVALFGMMFLRTRHWKRYAVATLSLEFLTTLASGSFHGLLLWGMMFVLVLSYIEKWGKKTVRVMLLGMLAVLVLQSVKEVYRDQFWFGKSAGYSQSRVVAFFGMTADVLTDPASLFEESHIADSLVRLNQGWIVNRVMVWTPKMQPYAEGATIKRSIVAIVPRFLVPGKASTAGRVDFETYTGHELFGGASMGLGYAGEMYANFGYWGGIFGVFIYGLLLGLGFRFLYRMALKSALWWAWGAYIFLIAVKAESTVGYVLNWSVKAAIVMGMVLIVSPVIRRTLFPPSVKQRPF
jgi:hypothetical protein